MEDWKRVMRKYCFLGVIGLGHFRAVPWSQKECKSFRKDLNAMMSSRKENEDAAKHHLNSLGNISNRYINVCIN